MLNEIEIINLFLYGIIYYWFFNFVYILYNFKVKKILEFC